MPEGQRTRISPLRRTVRRTYSSASIFTVRDRDRKAMASEDRATHRVRRKKGVQKRTVKISSPQASRALV